MKTIQKLLACPLHISPVAGFNLLQAVKNRESTFQAKDSTPQAKDEWRIDKRPKVDYCGDELPQMEMVNGVAVIPMWGTLVKAATGFEKWAYSVCSHEDIAEDMDRAAAEGCRGIVLNVNCPGGSHIGCAELARKVATIRDSGTTIYSFTGNQLASAAEYITAACSGRFVTQSAIVGCIGSMLEVQNMARWMAQLGVDVEVITSGEYKGMGHPAVPLTKAQRAFLQGYVTRSADEFKDWLKLYRPEVPEECMEGQFFTGAEAVKIGLHDAVVTDLKEVLEMI